VQSESGLESEILFMKKNQAAFAAPVQSVQQDSEYLEKASAAKVLEDEISEIQIALQKAQYILQDIVDKFFSCPDPEKKSAGIIYEFPRNAVKAEIVYDYLREMDEALKDLQHYSTPNECIRSELSSEFRRLADQVGEKQAHKLLLLLSSQNHNEN